MKHRNVPVLQLNKLHAILECYILYDIWQTGYKSETLSETAGMQIHPADWQYHWYSSFLTNAQQTMERRNIFQDYDESPSKLNLHLFQIYIYNTTLQDFNTLSAPIGM
jgi:hypothetical protein